MADTDGSSQRVSSGLTRFNGISAGVSIGLLAGAVFCLTTLALSLKETPPRHLALFSQYFPGYRVSMVGAFIGGFWVSLVGFLASTPAAMFYYRGLLKDVARSAGQGPGSRVDDSPDDHLGVDVAVLQVPRFALAIGLSMGILLFLAVALLLVNHQEGTRLGPHLSLLGHYLPGFRITWTGGILGAGYFFVIGALVASCVAGLYNRLAGQRTAR